MTLKRSRALTPLTLLLATFVALSPPAQASGNTFEILASGAQTATAQSGEFSVLGYTELTVFVTCTAGSGTSDTLDVYLQSKDGAGNWFDLPFELGQVTNTGASETAATTNKRDILERTADQGCTNERGVAKYRTFGNKIRAAWVIGGTGSPTFTFTVQAVGKN